MRTSLFVLWGDRKKDIAVKRRMEELDKLFQRIYEDNVSGKISDERFEKLSGGYEAEQKDLQQKAAVLQVVLEGRKNRR